MNLVSERITVDDYEQAVELFFERRWTDGLPVVLPTRRRVEAVIEHVHGIVLARTRVSLVLEVRIVGRDR